MTLFFRKSAAAAAPDPASLFPGEDKQMRDRLLLEALQALEDGDYDRDIRIEGELGRALAGLAAKLRQKSIGELARTVGFSSHASHSMVAVANVVDNIRQVSADAGAMAASVEEMSASVSQVAESSASTSDAAQQAQETAQASTRQIHQASSAMSDILRHVEALSARLGVLEEAAQQIEGMAQTIEDISDQTKLLALNATIEAARAGEAGKGFAVVANEVKSLSEQTSSATDSIRQRITTLNSEMREMKGAMSASNDAVSRGDQMVAAISQQIETIVEQVAGASYQVTDIAEALDQQRIATGEIAENVHKIASRANTSMEGMTDMIKTVADTDRLINEQFGELDRLNIPNYVLHRAKSDHLIWKKKLAEMLAGLNGLAHAELADHHSCRLGKWYDAVTERDLIASPSFRELQGPHEKVHRHGKQCAQHYADENLEAARAEYARMDEASTQVLDLLDRLIRDNER